VGIKSISGREVSLVASTKTVDGFRGTINIGEVLRGRIIEVFPENKVLVAFKGFNLIAETPLLFNKGDVFYAQVKEKEPKVLVKILPPGHPPGLTDEDIMEVIQHFGRAPTQERVQIIKHLIKHNLAVTKEMIDEIERHLSFLEGNTDENITTLLFMKAHNLKPSPTNVELIKLHLFERLNMGRALTQLQEALLKTEFEGKERLLSLIEELPIRLNEERADEQIRNFIRSLGIGYEYNLAGGFDLDGRGGHEDLRDRLPRGKSLKIELLRLLNILKRMGKEDLSPDKIRLQEAVQRVLKHILSFQLTSSQEGEDAYLYLQLPIHSGEALPQMVELKVYYQKKGKEDKVDMDHLQFSLILETSKLGVVEVRVGFWKDVGSLEFRLEDEYKRMFLNREIPSLKETLLALDYKINQLTTLVKREDESWPREEIDLKSLGRIDLRV